MASDLTNIDIRAAQFLPKEGYCEETEKPTDYTSFQSEIIKQIPNLKTEPNLKKRARVVNEGDQKLIVELKILTKKNFKPNGN